MTHAIDPLSLAQALIRCPSVTPEEAGALDVLGRALEGLGFACHRLTFSEAGTDDVDNLYARRGKDEPNFCFAGHLDVVPPGEVAAWSEPPFAGRVIDGRLHGRGAVDMKSAVACFVAACQRFVADDAGFRGSVSVLITMDEEGPALNGTAKVLRWLDERGEKLDACLVGEPTNPAALGEMIKIGRRGSLSGTLTVHGTQGHTAYPHLADNPIPRLMKMLTAIAETPLDDGSDSFEPSNLAITTVDVGNPATNVIPAKARAVFNIRYNDLHTAASLEAWLGDRCRAVGGAYDLDLEDYGGAFVCPPGRLSEVVAAAVERVIGRKPELDTSGGTSDARFIKDHCPVAEFGLVGESAHKIDESVPVDDIEMLTEVYRAMLHGFFAPGT